MQCEIKEVQLWSNIMKTIQETIPKTQIHFNKDTIEIRDIDKTHTALIHMSLVSNKISSSYKLLRPVSIGVDIENMYKVLKILKPPMCLRMLYKETTGDRFSITVFKDDSCRKREYRLPIYTINTLDTAIKDLPIRLKFTLTSRDFYDLCTHLLIFGDSCKIEIDNNKHRVLISSNGDVGTAELEYSQSVDKNVKLEFLSKDKDIFSQSYSLEKWKEFSQAHTISDKVCLCFSKDSPMLVHYKIKNDMGDMKFYLAPKVEDL